MFDDLFATSGPNSNLNDLVLKFNPRAVVVVALLIVLAWLGIGGLGGQSVGKLSQVHHGKATWGELGAIATAGVACIVVIIWLVTKANETVATGAAGADAG